MLKKPRPLDPSRAHLLDKTKYYKLYQEPEHLTENFNNLNAHIEFEIKKGNLNEYVKDNGLHQSHPCNIL